MIRGVARYVLSSREHSDGELRGMCQSPCRCTFPAVAFLFGHSGSGASHGAGSVSAAIPLTRLRIVVLAREEDPMASARALSSVSALICAEILALRADQGETKSESTVCVENATGSELDSSTSKRRKRGPT